MDSTDKKSHTRWTTEFQHGNYARKLMLALRHVRQNTSVAPSSRAVRQAADRALAIAAKGRTRWSRAILSSRAGPILRKRTKIRPSALSRRRTFCELRQAETMKLGLSGRVRTLGRLVPGCRKVSLPAILTEATDYIAALEMQVKAMKAIAELLSSAAPSRPTQPD